MCDAVAFVPLEAVGGRRADSNEDVVLERTGARVQEGGGSSRSGIGKSWLLLVDDTGDKECRLARVCARINYQASAPINSTDAVFAATSGSGEHGAIKLLHEGIVRFARVGKKRTRSGGRGGPILTSLHIISHLEQDTGTPLVDHWNSVASHGVLELGLTGMIRYSFVRTIRLSYVRRHFATAQTKEALDRTRNVGIIAHIDAGKTTTTERFLFYSGYTRRIGDVDDGSTVTDFLPAERARGITIQSAAISFSWPPSSANTTAGQRSLVPHNINLIDTPGHADFTFEVLRSLRVLDGAVCILDGVAGVEAQTEKVWSQASAYAIPRTIYVNKLDRDGAAFGQTIKEIGSRLGVWPAVCGIPWWSAEGKLQGIGDVVGLRGLRYAEGGDGKDITVSGLEKLEVEDSELAEEIKKARIALVELLSEHDDAMVEDYLEADEDHLAISPEDITESLRICALRRPQHVVPVFAGASFRNVGVQPVLDAVVDLLPSPAERPDPEISFGGEVKGGLAELLAGKVAIAAASTSKGGKGLSKDKATFALQNLEACALAFKVVADSKRGVLVYIRVYSGAVNRNSALWNTNLQSAERAQRLLKMYANDAVDVDSIPAGQIGVIPGLKAARTGDTLISYLGTNPKVGPPAPINSLQLRPIDVPPPVFFVSVEPSSLSEEKHIKESLSILLREDPSLHVTVDEESGQTHLSGMGELHLEIARDRLISDLKAKARIGSIEIGYREAPTALSEEVTEVFEREVGGKSSKAACTASVKPHSGEATSAGDAHIIDLAENNRLSILTPTLYADGSSIDPDQPGLPEHVPIHIVLQAMQNGVSAALARGPAYSYPVHSSDIAITFDPTTQLFPTTTPAAISSAARVATQHALRNSAKQSEAVMMEPVMLVTISVDESSMGSVVHDISSARGGTVVSLSSDEETSNIGQSIDVAKIYAPPDPYAGGHAMADASTNGNANTMKQIVARVPLKEMVGYLKHLRSLTGGRGTFTMAVDRFERMASQRQRAVLNEMRGDFT
ncbi:Ribosome-releasing factor 2, mitochondrial [Saxophila tyrrhenica]|uniref:Ribosome-releasing factor 2, mitochondrial n=1 Tax=Saxophila tyrrhenica TaxID=1690608 RepID=A0AAV9PM42_9PEZI|nr:Ribosome-releasing factor 2, mitochondrial [Saxophila tyrrhenica]